MDISKTSQDSERLYQSTISNINDCRNNRPRPFNEPRMHFCHDGQIGSVEKNVMDRLESEGYWFQKEVYVSGGESRGNDLFVRWDEKHWIPNNSLTGALFKALIVDPVSSLFRRSN
jgi:hypothetical protein